MMVAVAIAKEARSLKIRRGRSVVFGFSDVTCALLAVGAPTDQFHCCR